MAQNKYIHSGQIRGYKVRMWDSIHEARVIKINFVVQWLVEGEIGATEGKFEGL